MEDKYPWLRLCEGHWKVRQIWDNHYRKSRIHAIIDGDPELQKKFPVSKNKTLEPIEVSSDAERPPPTQKKKHAVVVISSDPEDQSPPPENTANKACVGSSDSSTGLKRGCQDTDDLEQASPKKPKYKGKETATSGFHHAKPQQKKTSAKIGTVSRGPPCLSITY